MRRLKGRAYPPGSRRGAIDEELEFHIEERTAELIAQGHTEAQARAEVLRSFGDLAEVRRACLALDRQRDRRATVRQAGEAILDDLRLAARSLVRSPRFSLLVITVLALGIGASVAVWSVVDRVLLQQLPFAQPDRLVHLWQNDRLTGTSKEPASLPDYFDFKERVSQFETSGAYSVIGGNFLLQREGQALPEARRVDVATVTHELLGVLGRQPIVGRGFTAAEDLPDGGDVALVEESFWHQTLGADPDIVGRSIRLDDRRLTVVGVVPRGLEIPSSSAAIWIPMQQTRDTSPRWSHSTYIVARLSPDATFEQAQGRVEALAAELEAEFQTNANRGAFIEPLQTTLRGNVRPALLVLLAAVAVVLAIVCANVANLMLARGAQRSGEVAMSAALGASGLRVGRRLFLESLLLTSLAAALGCLGATQVTALLLRLAPPSVSALSTKPLLDLRVLLFAVALTSAVTLFFGLVGALQARNVDLAGALRRAASGPGSEGAGRRLMMRRALVVAQFALALPLLCGAALLLLSLDNLRRVDKGFRSEGVLRIDYQLPESRYPRDMGKYPHWPEVQLFNRAMLEAANVLPGVTSAALTISHPLDAGFTNSFTMVGRETEDADLGELKTRLVSPSYFETNGVDLLEGRLLADSDSADAHPVLVVNQKTVQRYFKDRPVLGQRIAFWGIEREIVGIVGNERMLGIDQEPPEAMYASILQAPQRAGVTLMVHTQQDPLMLVEPLRKAAQALDAEVALFNVGTMDQTVSDSVARQRFTSMVLTLFALVATVLAALGIHGVLSYLVALRRREVGIRRALGASRGQVVSRILAEGLTLAGLGVAMGLALTFALARLLESLLYGTTATHAPTYVAATLMLLGLGALACSLPARRAANAPPTEALRQ